MIILEAFLPEVFRHLPGVPRPLALASLLKACQTFGERTGAWKKDLAAANIVAGTAVYTLTPPVTNARIVKVLWLKHLGQSLTQTTPEELETYLPGWSESEGQFAAYYVPLIDDGVFKVRLVPTPTEAGTGGLTGTVVLTPSSLLQEVPGEWFDWWRSPIAHGAVADLVTMPEKPWTNPPAYPFHNGQFELGLFEARVRAMTSFGNFSGEMSVRPFGGIY